VQSKDRIEVPIDAIVCPPEVEWMKGLSDLVSNFYRLFMVPGFDHCGLQSGVGISQSGLDPLSALERWVEKGCWARHASDHQVRCGRDGRAHPTAVPVSAAGEIERRRCEQPVELCLHSEVVHSEHFHD
jgi:hypothetical protein